jgi:hypothetical protein
MSGAKWVVGSPNVYPNNGQINITDCWLHDNRADAPPNFSSAVSYVFNDLVWDPNFTGNNKVWVCILAVSGGADPHIDTAHWQQVSTNDHTNGVMYTSNSPNSCSNLLVKHCTISGIGNTYGVSFQHVTSPPGAWINSTTYTTQDVAASDGFAYVGTGAGGNLNQNPAGNTNTTFWTQDGVGSYRNLRFINNHISGFNRCVELGAGCAGSTGIVFEDNIISNAIPNVQLVYDGTGSYVGPYVPLGGLFNGTAGCSWRRNIFQAWPGSAAWDAANAGKDGYFVIPTLTAGSYLSTSDWPN